MTNTSATGGYLASTYANTQDAALIEFLQEVIVGVTGIDGTLVRPRWQQVAPNQPDINTSWAAIGIQSRETSTYLYEVYDPANNREITTRNEDLGILCSFYGPNAEANASAIRDGLGLGQNREKLQLGGVAFIDTSNIINTSSLINNQWYYRVDITINVRRQLIYIYPVENILTAGITLEADDQNTRAINVHQ